MKAKPTECVFCAKFGRDARHQRSKFDTVIWSNDDFVLVPAVGSLVQGYLLIISREHYPSIAGSAPELLSGLPRVQSAVREVVAEYFGEPIFFEHGLVCPRNRAGSCIDHMHLHCVPLQPDLTPKLKAAHHLAPFTNLRELADFGNIEESYLYFENQRLEKFMVKDPKVPSQYVRRLIANSLGIGSQWDWAVFDFEDKLRLTLAVATELGNKLRQRLNEFSPVRELPQS